MSEPGRESIPTSQDPRSKRPVKKRALTPVSAQAAQVDALFAHPEKEVKIPTGPVKKSLPPPPEIVANVQGSSAGAGSGEFHVYKASRRREYERLRLMDEEVRKEELDTEFEKKREEIKRKDEEKTNKNRAKREKQKLRKQKQKSMKDGAGDDDNDDKTERIKKLNPKPPAIKITDPAEQDGQEDVPTDASNANKIGIVIHDED